MRPGSYIVVALLLALACRVDVLTQRTIVGIWESNESFSAKQVLVMRTDGTFAINTPSGETVAQGRWRILNTSGRDTVNFTYTAREGNRIVERGDVTRAVRRRFGRLVMDIDSDSDVYFAKRQR